MTNFISPLWRIISAIIFLLFCGSLSGAQAADVHADVRFDGDYCYAVTELSVPDSVSKDLNFTCDTPPQHYQHESLWLKIADSHSGSLTDDVAIMVHQSRFNALSVGFIYADGAVRWKKVRNGDFGTFWRVGGQLRFTAPNRVPGLVSAILRFDELTDYGLLRIRFMPEGKASQESASVAAIVSGALMLLLVCFIYSLSLASAARRPQLLWQTAWAGVMVIWGLVWSQMHLMLLPSLAGAASAQFATLLATSAIALGFFAAIHPMQPQAIPRWMRTSNLWLAALIAVAGVPLAVIRHTPIVYLDKALGLLVALNLLLAGASMVIAWRRGYRHGRDMIMAWSVPMLVLGFISVVNIDNQIWGGGSKLVVLVASSWLAIWSTLAATRRVHSLRDERDAAQRAADRAMQLAVRDPLTGLNNRRGFQDQVTRLMDYARADQLPMALILVDIDRFKSINDRFGHDVGDHVLCAVASEMERWEGAYCAAGRVGGEEFALFLVGVDGLELRRFADAVRRAVAECDLKEWTEGFKVTASVGVAEASVGTAYQTLYRTADRALYNAKNAGRDRLSVARVGDPSWDGSGEGLALLH